MTNEKLKPCPFCDGQVLSIGHYRRVDDVIYFVFCENIDCNAEGPWDLGESGAIEKWNTRKDKK